MLFARCIYVVLIMFVFNFSSAQNNNSIQVSICIQHAITSQHIIGASVVIKDLDDIELMNVQSMYSSIFIPTCFEANHQYNIIIQKKGFHTLDTVITTKVTSTSNKQRLGLYLSPIVCHYIKGSVLDASHLEKIETGKIIFRDLQTKLSTETEIKNGYYEFCGITGHQYHITAIIDGHFEKIETLQLYLNHNLKLDEQEFDLTLEVAKNYDKSLFDGDSITVHGFTFNNESSTLSSQGQKEVKKLIHVMKQMPQLLFSIAVQAEEFIDTRFNRKLAEQRARMIEHELSTAGISPHRYLLICKGKVDATTPEASKNQRVCLWLRK